jgi:hypothetical protein
LAARPSLAAVVLVPHFLLLLVLVPHSATTNKHQMKVIGNEK